MHEHKYNSQAADGDVSELVASPAQNAQRNNGTQRGTRCTTIKQHVHCSHNKLVNKHTHKRGQAAARGLYMPAYNLPD